MPFAAFRLAALLAMLFVSLPGCNYFQGNQVDSDADLADLDDETPQDAKPELKDGASPANGEFALNLKVGDRFPFTKRIEQRLTQADAQGVSVYRSLTEMLLSLSVREVRDGRKRIDVHYHRVRYGQDIAGK